MAEKDAFIECVEAAKKDLPNISTITTDANPSIRSHIDQNEPDIKHGLDIWHLTKNLNKNIGKKATRKASI